MLSGLVTLFKSELVLSVWRHVKHIVISLNLLIQDKTEKRKCRGRESGLCNLLLSDSLQIDFSNRITNLKKKKTQLNPSSVLLIIFLAPSVLHSATIVLLLTAQKVRRGQWRKSSIALPFVPKFQHRTQAPRQGSPPRCEIDTPRRS